MGKDIKTIFAPLSEHLANVEKEIESRLKTGVPIIDASSLHLFLGGGKRIRASLVILTSGLRGPVPDGIIPLAAATEIVHAASLIHDDIIDKSMFRRGNITVPEKWGNKVAVLAGDFMYSVALNTAIQDGNPAIFPLMVNGTKDMVMGELCQIEYADIQTARREHYLKIVELKTAQFMGSCCRLGAVKAGLDQAECDSLYRFGLALGFAFQIIDDTLDISRKAEEVGKDVGSDFKDGKITLPFLYLIEKGGAADLERLKKYMENPEPAAWEVIRKRLADSGAIEHAVQLAGEYIDRARALLGAFPDSGHKSILLDLSDFLLNRTY